MAEYNGLPPQEQVHAELDWMQEEIRTAIGDNESLNHDQKITKLNDELLEEIKRLKNALYSSLEYVPSEEARRGIKLRVETLLNLIESKKLLQNSHEYPKDSQAPSEFKTTRPN